MYVPNTQFGDWLLLELEARHLKQADLYRAIGATSAGVSLWITGKVTPSVDNLRKIALYLGVPEIEVLRRAGIATSRPDNSPLVEQIVELSGRLTIDDQQDIIDFIRAKLARQTRRARETE